MFRHGRKMLIALVLGIGLLVGGGAILSVDAVNKYTSATAFCTSCHSMATLANDPHFQRAPHIANAAGVNPSCGDCHIPSNNFFIETYTHVTKGVKDLIAERSYSSDDAAAWEARRVALADSVRFQMRSQDSVTCRSCHNAADITPQTTAGKAAHALLQSQQVTCIDCHMNLVHAPVPPSLEFLRSSGLGETRNGSD